MFQDQEFMFEINHGNNLDKFFSCCETPATIGGETTVLSIRKFMKKLALAIYYCKTF